MFFRKYPKNSSTKCGSDKGESPKNSTWISALYSLTREVTLSKTSFSLPLKYLKLYSLQNSIISSSKALIVVATIISSINLDFLIRLMCQYNIGFPLIILRTFPGNLEEPNLAWIDATIFIF